jgi:integrase
MGVGKRGKTWTAYANWMDQNGEKQQKSEGGFATKKEAQKRQRELLNEVDSGRKPGKSSPKLSDYLNEWLPKHRNMSHLKESTYETYKMLISVYIIPNIGHLRIGEIRTATLEEFYLHLQTSGRAKTKKDGDTSLSSKTVRNIASLIGKAFKDAVRLGEIPFNPADSAIKPKLNPADVDFMTPDNLRKYVASIQEHDFGFALQLVALTGMRRGELLGLSWKDVDFKTGQIDINRTRIRAGNRIIFDTPKSKTSKRIIEIDLHTMQRLRAWKTKQARQRLTVGGLWSDDEDLVVTDPIGNSPSFSAFDRMFKHTLRAVGLAQMKFHSLRHSYVIAALRAGGTLKAVSERVGHSDPSVTNRIYNHVIDGDDREVADNTALFILGNDNPGSANPFPQFGTP